MKYQGNKTVITPIFSDSNGTVRLNDMFINISVDDPFNPNDSAQYALFLSVCNENSLNVKCASDNEIMDFFARSPATLALNVQLSQYDL